MKQKALILYISKYSGHYHGARAIENALYEINPEAEVETINAIDYTNPILGKVVNKAYLEVIKKKPHLWGNIYDNPEVLKKTKKAREAVHRYNMSKIKKLFKKYSPDVVICTQAFPCGMVSDYKKATGSDTLLLGVLTDYAPHSYWLHDEVDHYIVPSEEIGKKLEEKGVEHAKIKTYGIPVDPKYCLKHDKGKIRRELGFSSGNPVILIMGGSQGIGAVEDIVKQLLQDAMREYQLLVITGKNRRLYSRLKRIGRRANSHMKVLPYVENIGELMEASDIIITKAGGLTTAEALVKELPILIVDPIPGHERMNTDFLIENGAAIEVDDFREIYHLINRLFDSKDKLDIMSSKALKLSKPESSLNIAKLAFEGS